MEPAAGSFIRDRTGARLRAGRAVVNGRTKHASGYNASADLAANIAEGVERDMDMAEPMTTQEKELAELIVSALNLEVSADEIDAQAPLYRDGLGLDSIDILEIALAVSRKYGFQLRSDDSDNIKTFSSLRNLNQHVQRNRTL
ncbi:MAG TPA: phosphopantetheine-binding protein [Burkholderiales bacterium]|nr:phosphopantetheine-binding protein [Burkholderiales bacterium]